MDEYHTALACEHLPGESFLPEVRRRVKPHAHRVRLVPADFTTYQWQDGPIKLLLVDAMKTWVLGASITRSFFPSLVPGALVIHQDYKCYDTPWIPIIQFRLQDLFHFTHGVRKGCAVAFELREKIPSELIVGIVRQGGISEALRFLETAEQKGEFPPS